MKIFDWAVQLMGIALALAAAPVFLGWVNKCRAWLQNKSAPSILQPYRGIRKLFHKEAVIAQNASQLFRLAPYVVFGAMVTAAAVIPSVATRLPITRAADAIALVGLLATARVFLSLAAMDIGTAFGTLGARREMMIGFLAEPALLVVIFIVSLTCATTALPIIAERLSAQTFLFADFVVREPFDWPKLDAEVIVHGHCHQKALFGMQGDTTLLERLGVKWKLLDTGCCGMAGSFGFNAEHQALSEKIGEDKLFPAIRSAAAQTIVLTSGFSCREQIEQGTGRHALHIAQLAQRALAARSVTPTASETATAAAANSAPHSAA